MRPLPDWIRSRAALGGLALLVGLLLRWLRADPIAQAVGTALIAGGGLGLLGWQRERLGAAVARVDRPWLRAALPPLGLLALALYLFGHLLGATIPAGEDHPVHLYHAWNMAERMLPTGRITGWSHHQFAGYPAFVLYAPGPYLAIAVLSYVVPLQVAYDLVLFGTVAGVPLLLYALLRQHGISRAAAWFAGVLALLDRGVYNELGWDQVVVNGIWPHAFAVLLVLATLCGLRATLVRPGPGRAIGVALAAGAALISHPLGLVYLVPSVTLYLLVFARAWRPLVLAAAGLVIGGLLAGFWLWPFIELEKELVPHGQHWYPLREVGQRLLEGTLFENAWALAYAAGVGAMIGGFDRRRPLHRFGLLAAAAFMLMSARDLWVAYGYDVSMESFDQINFWRIVAAVRLVWMAFAGAGVAAVLRRIQWRRALDYPHIVALGLVPALLLLPPVVRSAHEAFIEAPRQIQRLDQQPYYADLLATAADIRERAGDGFTRVLASEPRGTFCVHLLPVLTGLPITHLGGEPTFHHRLRFWEHRPAVLRQLGVRFVVSCRNRPGVTGLKRLAQHGEVTLYELPNPAAERFRLPRGSAEVTQARFEDEEMVFQVANPSAGATLQVPVVGFPRWRATLNGQEIPIRLTPLPPSGVPFFMEVDLREAGELRFEFRTSPRQRAGLAMSILGLIGIVALLIVTLRRRRLEV